MNTQKCISDSDLGRLCEGSLSFQEKQTLQEHISSCPDCKARWEKVLAGSQYVDEMLFKTAGRGQNECPSEGQITAFIAGSIDQFERQKIQAHLSRCSQCSDALSSRFGEAYENEDDSWWSQFTAEQLLRLFAKLSDAEIDGIASELKVGFVSARPTEVIKLPVLEPPEKEIQRLAAATGEGFATQKLHQDEPAFDFEVTQFGEQIRITARSQDKTHAYQNCLARLELLEEGRSRFSRIILIEQGEGKCVLQPDQVKSLQLEKGRISLRLSPLITSKQIDEAGSEAYTPILNRLIEHQNPKIRCGAIEVIARICGLQVRSLIESVAEKDEDASVRATARKALDQMPSPGPKKS